MANIIKVILKNVGFEGYLFLEAHTRSYRLLESTPPLGTLNLNTLLESLNQSFLDLFEIDNGVVFIQENGAGFLLAAAMENFTIADDYQNQPMLNNNNDDGDNTLNAEKGLSAEIFSNINSSVNSANEADNELIKSTKKFVKTIVMDIIRQKKDIQICLPKSSILLGGQFLRFRYDQSSKKLKSTLPEKLRQYTSQQLEHAFDHHFLTKKLISIVSSDIAQINNFADILKILLKDTTSVRLVRNQSENEEVAYFQNYVYTQKLPIRIKSDTGKFAYHEFKFVYDKTDKTNFVYILENEKNGIKKYTVNELSYIKSFLHEKIFQSTFKENPFRIGRANSNLMIRDYNNMELLLRTNLATIISADNEYSENVLKLSSDFFVNELDQFIVDTLNNSKTDGTSDLEPTDSTRLETNKNNDDPPIIFDIVIDKKLSRSSSPINFVDETQKIIESLKTNRLDLQICLPINAYGISKIPLRFSYDKELAALVYVPNQLENNVFKLNLTLKYYFTNYFKFDIFSLNDNHLCIPNLEMVASCLREFKNVFNLVSKTSINEKDIDTLLVTNTLQIIINLQTQSVKNREIIFRFDHAMNSYIFKNVEILEPNETYATLNLRIFENVFKPNNIYINPLSAKNNVLKIMNNQDIKRILNCNFAYYSKATEQGIYYSNRNNLYDYKNLPVYSFLNQTQTNQTNRLEKTVNSNNDNSNLSCAMKLQKLMQLYKHMEQFEDLVEFEETLRTLLPSPDKVIKKEICYVIILNPDIFSELQKLIGGPQSKFRMYINSLSSIFAASNTNVFLFDLEQYMIWWNNRNPYCGQGQSAKRLKTTLSTNNVDGTGFNSSIANKNNKGI